MDAVPTRTKPALWKRFLKWTVISLLALIVLLAVAGFTYNEIARRADARQFPQLGNPCGLALSSAT
ncbi:MAG TPA: hypothetical protein VFP71_11420 [Candidatus Angelobacter sp.]|nr:hypothetical protein [Candidatus Angelobacter sp.]